MRLWVGFRLERRKNMEAFGIFGFIFVVEDLAKVITLEKQLKEFGPLKEKTESDDK